jgi:hypothetical protein
MKKLLLALTTLLLIAGVASADPMKFEGNGHWYEAVSAPNMSWTDANIAASNLIYDGMAGHLATITDALENAFIFGQLSIGGSPYWLGGFQPDSAIEPSQGWQWVTGEDWDYTNWANGEPNNSTGGNEDSLAFAFFQNDGTWNDAPTGWTGYSNGGYVVEYEPVPEPGTVILLGLGIAGLVTLRRKSVNR